MSVRITLHGNSQVIGTGLPLSILLSTIPSLPRAQLSRLVEQMIDRMDALDGDDDLESNGDELDGTGGEDDFMNQSGRPGSWGGPGCPISDPDLCVDDEGEFDEAL